MDRGALFRIFLFLFYFFRFTPGAQASEFLQITPERVVVKYGTSVSVNCSTKHTHWGMGWEASLEPVPMTREVQLVTWKVDSLTHWDIRPICYIIGNDSISEVLNITVYKPPDRVSISTVSHTGPMTEGREYVLLCEVENVAPVHLLTVTWYKGETPVKKRNDFYNIKVYPGNVSDTLQIVPNRADDGVQYRCEAELNLESEENVEPKVKSAPLNLTVHFAQASKVLQITPERVVVKFGTSVSVNCSTNTTHKGMGLEASLEHVPMTREVQLITWKVDSLTHWDIKPICYIIINETDMYTEELNVTVYKPPDRVSISTVSHTGPMTEGREYVLLCEVENVAPVHLLNVTWYKGETPVKKRNDFYNNKKGKYYHPGNVNDTLQIVPNRADDGVQYRCEAELDLESEENLETKVKSAPLNLTVHCAQDSDFLQITPERLVVKYGTSVSVNCSTKYTNSGMGWEVSQGGVQTTREVQLITWKLDSLTHWDIRPICYINVNYTFIHQEELKITVYKLPDRVSISTVSHTGPMTEGREYVLLCEVENVAPLHLLTVTWYKGETPVTKRNDFYSIMKVFPGNVKDTLQIVPNRADDGVQYRCEAELNLESEEKLETKVKSAPLNLTVHCTQDSDFLQITPERVMVKYGTSVSVNCSTKYTHGGMGWEVSQGAVPMTRGVQLVTWKVDSLTHWDTMPICYMNSNDNNFYQEELKITVYKLPDRVSISTVNHTGPMTEDREYVLLCEVENVAPVHLLTVTWYKGETPVRNINLSHSITRPSPFPGNVKDTLQIVPNRTDDGVQYRCEAELNLESEEKLETKVKSAPLNLTVHFGPEVSNCPPHLWLEEGESLKDYCTTTGNPVPHYHWEKDGQVIDPHHPLSRTSTGNYTIIVNERSFRVLQVSVM